MSAGRGAPRWLFHVARADAVVFDAEDRYAPASLANEGFIHASYAEAVAESARLYFPADAALVALAIDPRRLDAPLVVADTPRGPMPHVHGSIPRDAIGVMSIDEAARHADRVTGTRIGFAAFEGMTLLDLVGPLDALSRIASMGFDATTTCEVFALTPAPGDDGRASDVRVFAGLGLDVRASRVRPPLAELDVLVVPGGLGARALQQDAATIAYLASFPPNRLTASVCTGALLLGAAGRLRGRRAATHASARAELARYGAEVSGARVVDEGQLVTAGGVTSGIDLGLHLVARLAGDEVRDAVARQMEVASA